MATGHVLPAQKEAVSNLYRVQAAEFNAQSPKTAAGAAIKPSFLPENNNRRWLLTQAPVDAGRLEAIRRQARELWTVEGGAGLGIQPEQPHQQMLQPPAYLSTSYQRHYSAKHLDEPTQLRPTSPNRRNNPHPPMVFLTCRMHNVPGFSNADSVTDKAPYQMDASRAPAERAARQQHRAKFTNRPDDNALRQYADKDPAEEVFGQKLEFRVSNLGRIDDEMDDDFMEARKRMTDWQQSAMPSLHRYLKFQGPIERDRLGRSAPGGAAALNSAERWRQREGQREHLRQLQRRCTTAGNSFQQQQQRLVYQPTRVRGDYLIHPKWPPTLPHHRVP